MPAIVGANGVENIVPFDIDEEEAAKLKKSADTLKEIISQL